RACRSATSTTSNILRRARAVRVLSFFFAQPDLCAEIAPERNSIMSTKVPADLKYAKSHEWLRLAGDLATVGITDHAPNELTDVVFVELPAVGRKVKAGEACAVVESVKTASDIYAPVSGEVIEVNKAVADNPALVNSH